MKSLHDIIKQGQREHAENQPKMASTYSYPTFFLDIDWARRFFIAKQKGLAYRRPLASDISKAQTQTV